MSTYNTDFQLVRCTLNQDFQDLEIIVIDDGSDNDSQNLKFGGSLKFVANLG